MRVFGEIYIFSIILACYTVQLESKEVLTRKVFDRVPIFSESDAKSIVQVPKLSQCEVRCQGTNIKSFAFAPSKNEYEESDCVCLTEEDPFSHGLITVPGAILYENVENQVGLSQFLLIDALPVGGFMYSEQPVSLKQCSLSCGSASQTENRCQAFEYSVIKQECNLYSQSHIENGTDMKGRVNDGQRTMYFEYMNFLLRPYSALWSRLINGTFLNSSKPMNANECAMECNRHPQCDGFNYYSDELKCEMFNKSSETTQSNRNVISFQTRGVNNDEKHMNVAKLRESDEMERTGIARKETTNVYLNSINSTFTASYTDLQNETVLVILRIKNTDAKGRLGIQLSQVHLGMDSEEHCSTGVLDVQAGWRSNFSFCNYKSNEPDIITNASEAQIAISTFNTSIHNPFAPLQQSVYLKISAIADVEMNVTNVLQDTVIRSPSKSGKYLPNIENKWIIQENDGMIPIVSFVSFQLALFQFAGTEACDNDRLYLDYGNVSNPLCGHLDLPKQMVSPFKNYTIVFKTDDRYEDAGFEIIVTLLKEFPCATKGATSVTTSGILFHLSEVNENQTCDWLLSRSFNVTIKFCQSFWVKRTQNSDFEYHNCSSTNYLHLEENSTIRWKSSKEDSWFVAILKETHGQSTSTPQPTFTTHSVPSISSTATSASQHTTTTSSQSTITESTSTSSFSLSTSSIQNTTNTTPQEKSTITESSTTSSISLSTSSIQNTTNTTPQENIPLIIGLSITAFVVLVIIVAAVVFVYKRRQIRDRTLSQEVLPNTSLEINADAFEANENVRDIRMDTC